MFKVIDNLYVNIDIFLDHAQRTTVAAGGAQWLIAGHNEYLVGWDIHDYAFRHRISKFRSFWKGGIIKGLSECIGGLPGGICKGRPRKQQHQQRQGQCKTAKFFHMFPSFHRPCRRHTSSPRMTGRGRMDAFTMPACLRLGVFMKGSQRITRTSYG